MKARSIYLLIARDVINDPIDNMNSIIKVIEKFTTRAKADDLKESSKKLNEGQSLAVPATYFIASSWYLGERLKQAKSIDLKISMIDPSKKNLGGPEQNYKIPAGLDKINLNIKSEVLPITKSGRYTLRAELSIGGKLAASNEYVYEVDIQLM